MHGLLIRWIVLTISILVTPYFIDGISVNGFFSAVFTAAILGVLNAFFRPVLLILTLPINILTMGLFTFVINAVLLLMASGLVSGFQVAGFWTAVWAAVIISIFSWLLNMLVNPQGRIEMIRFEHHRRN